MILIVVSFYKNPVFGAGMQVELKGRQVVLLEERGQGDVINTPMASASLALSSV